MNLVLCTKKDIFGAVILNLLLPTLRQHRIRVLLSDKARPAEFTEPDLIHAKFLEHDLPVETVFPMLDAQRETGELLTFEALASKFRVSIDTIDDVNDAAAERLFSDWGTDMIVAVRFSLLFQPHILQIPRIGAFNVHPGALPGYAGLWSPLWAILCGEKQLGCTVHQIDAGIDTGPVYSVSYLRFQPERSVFAHIGELYMTGLASMLMLIEGVDKGIAPELSPQDRSARHYYSLPNKEDLLRFWRMGVAPVAYERYHELLQRFTPKPKTAAVLSAADHHLQAARDARPHPQRGQHGA